MLIYGNWKHKSFCVLVLILMKTSFFCKTSKQALGPTQYSFQRVKLTSHLHLVRKLRTSAATPLLPLYEFMAWTGKTSAVFRFVTRRRTAIRSSVDWNRRHRRFGMLCLYLRTGKDKAHPRIGHEGPEGE